MDGLGAVCTADGSPEVEPGLVGNRSAVITAGKQAETSSKTRICRYVVNSKTKDMGKNGANHNRTTAQSRHVLMMGG